MLAALAAVWLFIFVPSWMKSSVSREQQRYESLQAKNDRRQVRQKTFETLGAKKALRVRRAFVAKRVSGLISIASIVASLATAALFATIEQPWIYLLGFAGTFVISFSINRLANSLQLRALSDSSQTKRPVRLETSAARSAAFAASTPKASEPVLKDPRAWNAPGVPSQILRSPDGTLETPTIADVLDFVASAERRENDATGVGTETASINLDEILRRRRANG